MVLQFMKKLDNFTNCLAILSGADFKLAETNDIYRTGVIGQFNLTFELAWKALQEIMRMHSVEGVSTGSPREILLNCTGIAVQLRVPGQGHKTAC